MASYVDLPRVRRELEAEARAIATPRLWVDTLGALASTSWRVLATAAPDAPVALLCAAASAAGMPIAPPEASRGTLRRAERLVRAGGPTYIKLGQFIATAQGLLPDEWVDAFGWCRDTPRRSRPASPRSVRTGRGPPTCSPVRHRAARVGLDRAGPRRPSSTTAPRSWSRSATPGCAGQFDRDLGRWPSPPRPAERASRRAASPTFGLRRAVRPDRAGGVDFRFEALNQVELALASEAAGHDFATSRGRSPT